MTYFFSKVFNYYDLKNVDYWKCVNCGFTASKTHYDMSQEGWEKLNLNFHNDNNLRTDNPYNRNQRYFNQAQMIFLMKRFNLIEKGLYLDWGSGTGEVSSLSKNLYKISIYNFDKYIRPSLNQIFETELKSRNYKLVICNAVFEHVYNRESLDEIESFVSENGCFGIHTLIPESVPNDAEWMYLLPVHCSFHTNNSMNILIKQWKYTCSIYNEYSKMWVLFKNEPNEIERKVKHLNNSLGWDYFKFKIGFMDYWK